MSSYRREYDHRYRAKREKLLGQPCVWCGAPADTADHVPPLKSFPPGEWVGELLPACKKCNFGRRSERATRRRQREQQPVSGRGLWRKLR